MGTGHHREGNADDEDSSDEEYSDSSQYMERVTPTRCSSPWFCSSIERG